MWHGPTNSWIDKPPKPDDGKNYALDFDIYNWVEVVPPTQE
jgi:hypothetical protein